MDGRGGRGSGVAALRHPVQAFRPLAPRWLAEVMAAKDAPVPWADMVRTALSVAVPVLLGFLSGAVALGGLAALGAWLAAGGDSGGVFTRRAYRMGVGVVAGAAGLLLGRLTSGDLAGSLAVLAAAGLVAALLSAISADLSYASLQLLIYLAVGAGPLDRVPLGPLLLATLGGAAWALALSWLQTVVVPQEDAPRRAVATVLDALVDAVQEYQRGPGAGHGAQPGAREVPGAGRLSGPCAAATVAVARGYDAVIAARARSFGSRSDLDRLTTVLEAANGVVTMLVSCGAEPLPPEQADALVRRLGAVRARVVSRRPAPRHLAALPPDPGPGSVSGGGSGDAGPRAGPAESAMSALEHSVGRDDLGDRLSHGRRGPGELASTVTGPATRLYAARLVITLLVAQVVALAALPEHGYLVVLTAALVLKPDFGSVFARGVQRVVGTVVGSLIGGLVLLVVPSGPALALPAAVLGFLLPWGKSRNFGLMAVFLTPLVLVFVEMSGGFAPGLATGRALGTAVGAVVVLLVGYLPWPSTWRSHLEPDVAAFVDAVADYARVALRGVPSVVVPARRRAQGALTDVRSGLQAALAEPTGGARRAAAWFPLITALGQVVEDLRDVSVLASGARARGQDTGGAGDEEHVEAWLRELAQAVREGREPRDGELPSSGPLAVVVEDLRGVRRTVVGDEPSTAHDAR